MADAASSSDDQITVNIKGQNDAKYTITISPSATIRELKDTLSTAEYANLPAYRQRLIYSGRVLRDIDTISSTNIKSGHTVHMVRTAESNARQHPESSSSQAAPPAVPTNIAAGTGNSALAGLTGARYAGFHGLPDASMFGADGGLGPPMSPDQMERMLENPMFVSQLNEFMNSPQAMQVMEPLFNQNPQLREMMRNPDVRRVLFSPESIRTQMQLSRAMGGSPFGGMGGGSSFPAPGVTDNTGTATSQPPSAPAAGGSPAPAVPGEPRANPFAALFGGGNGGQQTPNLAANQFMLDQMFGGQRGAPGAAPAAGGADPTGAATGVGNAPGEADHNNLLRMLSMMQPQGGAGPNFSELFGGAGAAAPPAPADTRPPEERYADQLRQLNDMGFFDFDRNVLALRRSGGSVQGAVEHLLSNP